ncbi:hypothetical protein AB0P37_43630 [Streptomyces antimycoticus]|uniref:hypothetical protein n=1 Tax=Streptomyces antimycoticus TaxID=68175 RepID=UPI003426D781
MTNQKGRQEAPDPKTGRKSYDLPDPWHHVAQTAQHTRRRPAAVPDQLVHRDPRATRVRALHIDPDATSWHLELPEDASAQHDVLCRLIGDTVDRAMYHRQALLHVHGNGAGMRLPVNPAAWALACAWRRLDLPYLLYGPVIVTGPDTSGVIETLNDRLLSQAEEVARRTKELHLEWSTRPPVSESAARHELLAYARRATRPS